ncbi:MAG: GTP pyrophosphokinase [Gallicola sp.]|uniref:GTP pyrophosphokinase n=1 Tax=Gallicola sp. Sow4_E12 TaxID=3438785 RepID=UPI0017F0E5C6|nr:GTP pyrophosphokinase [Gallicola sp.]
MNLLKAFIIALKAHRGQKDKGGRPYIFHPLYVCVKVKGREEKIVALLHDVVEDSGYRIEDLDFLSQNQKEALALLTKDGSLYFDYIEKLKKNSIAVNVKLKDLEHNMNVSRIDEITEADLTRAAKYKKAYTMLNSLRD